MAHLRNLLLALFLLSLPAYGAVTVDSTAEKANNANSSDISWSHTIASSGDVIVLVMITQELNGGVVNSATFDGNAMTQIDYQVLSSSVPTMGLWYYYHTGSSGAKTISIDLASGARMTGASVAFTGHDTGATYDSSDLTKDDGGTDTSSSIAVSSATDDMVVGFLSLQGPSLDAAEDVTPGTSETERADILDNAQDCLSYIGTEPGGSSITINPSWTTSTYHRHWGISIAQATGGAATKEIATALHAIGGGLYPYGLQSIGQGF